MNELQNRLKNSINKQILNQVDKTLMEQYKFVPISVKDKYLFVAINSLSDKDTVNEKIKQTLDYPIKFIQVPDKDLDELIADLVATAIPKPVEEKVPQNVVPLRSEEHNV